MADETKRIEITVGPERGGRLDVPAKIADQAIKDGWAKDPFAPPSDEPPPEFDQDKYDKAIVAAEKAIRKLRGEEDNAASGAAETTETTETDKTETTTRKTRK
jgi:hypothetical protein